MKMKGNKYFYILLLGAIALISNMKVQAEDNMHFYGNLVQEPCVISDKDANIPLDFGAVIDKELYTHTRTSGQPFTIHLSECDLSIGKTVKITFLGEENNKITGLLEIAKNSQASGIAIGMETLKGVLLPINKVGEKYTLEGGSNSITLMAYLQGEPDAIKNHTIERGPFNAIATFNLEYE